MADTLHNTPNSIDTDLENVDTDTSRKAKQTTSARENRKLLRRIDLCLLPVLFVTYMFQYLDKATMANTAILGMRTDLHLKGQEYSWASSVFNFGYLTASPVVALLIVRLPTGKFMAISVICWGGVLMCLAATHNSAGLQAARFFLGFAEAAVASGFSIIIAMWYTRAEQPLRNGTWFLGNVVSGFFAGPVMYAFGHVESFAAWELVFLVFGAATVLWGVALFYLLPDSPYKARFLSESDRKSSVLRIKADAVAVKHNLWKMDQMWEAFRDPKAWLTALIMLATNVPNGGISNFASIVIHGFGFSVNGTFLVNMIVTAFQAFFVLVAALACTYRKNSTTYAMMTCTAIGLAGTCVIQQVNDTHLWTRYSGYCLLSAYTVNFPMILIMNTANNTGITKRTTVNAMSFVAYCVGNIVGPQLFFESELPSYPSGFASMLVCFVVAIVFTVILRFYLLWNNKKRDRETSPSEATEATSNDLSNDKTDWEISSFRYVY